MSMPPRQAAPQQRTSFICQVESESELPLHWWSDRRKASFECSGWQIRSAAYLYVKFLKNWVNILMQRSESCRCLLLFPPTAAQPSITMSTMNSSLFRRLPQHFSSEHRRGVTVTLRCDHSFRKRHAFFGVFLASRSHLFMFPLPLDIWSLACSLRRVYLLRFWGLGGSYPLHSLRVRWGTRGQLNIYGSTSIQLFWHWGDPVTGNVTWNVCEQQQGSWNAACVRVPVCEFDVNWFDCNTRFFCTCICRRLCFF